MYKQFLHCHSCIFDELIEIMLHTSHHQLHFFFYIDTVLWFSTEQGPGGSKVKLVIAMVTSLIFDSNRSSALSSPEQDYNGLSYLAWEIF